MKFKILMFLYGRAVKKIVDTKENFIKLNVKILGEIEKLKNKQNGNTNKIIHLENIVNENKLLVRGINNVLKEVSES